MGDDYRALLNSADKPEFEVVSSGYHPATRGWDFEHVYSPFARIYYAGHDRNHILHEGKQYSLDSLTILVIPEGVHFHCRSKGQPEHLWIHYKDNRWNRPEETRPFRIAAIGPILEICKDLISDHKGPNANLTRRYYKSKALTHLIAAELPLRHGPLPPPRFQEALKYIHNHLGENLKVHRLAEISGYSPEYLAALFKQFCKQTPHAYIRDARMREGARRLVYTSDSIDTIALDLGYANRHHFTRLFGQSLNMPPARFRKKHCIYSE